MSPDFADAAAGKLADLQPGPTSAHLLTVARSIMQCDVSLMITSEQGIIEFVNPAFERYSGYAAAEAVGRTPSLLNSGEHSREFFAGLRKVIATGEVFRAVFTNRRKNGDIYREDKMITPIRNGAAEISHYVATGHLLTAPADAPADHRDDEALTRIPHRQRFMNQLDQAITRSRRHSATFSLLHIDVDRFKRINDTLGHGTGDRVLAAVAQRIAQSIAGQDSVARLGGDEFAIIIEGRASRAATDAIAETLIGACSHPFEIDQHTLYAAISIGIAAYPDDGDDIESLVRHAEIAMYQAKSAGRATFVNFNAQMEEKMLDDLSIEASLRSALDNGEFEIHYQPIVSPGDGRTLALEALLRWHSPQHGEVSPVRFVPLLEEIGLIGQVGRWVLRTACAQFKSLARQGLAPAVLAVNLSAAQFRDSALIANVQSVLDESGLAPAQLELEITESILIDDASAGAVRQCPVAPLCESPAAPLRIGVII